MKMKTVFLSVVAAVLFAGAGTHGFVHACDTPVYRYAMYRWAPSPYEVYLFHDKELGEQELAVRDVVNGLRRQEKRSTNIVHLPVDMRVDEPLRRIPPDVRKLWEARSDKSLPQYLIVSPRGAPVFSGELKVAELDSLVASTKRTEIAKELAEARSGVMVLLKGSNANKNAEAEKMLRTLAKDVVAGKVQLYGGPQDKFGPTGLPKRGPQASATKTVEPQQEVDTDDAEKKQPPHSIGVVVLDRNDEKERWLVEMLLSVESDLKDEEFADAPMVFPVYGRARALPPYIGRGISRDNMLDCLAFITGACSCTVKEQNPGVDLLTSFDWDEAAAKMAEKFGSEEGNESSFGPSDFFPELILGGSVPVTPQPKKESSADPENSAADDK